MTSNPKHTCRFFCLAVALAIVSAAPTFASEQSHAKHAGNIKNLFSASINLRSARIIKVNCVGWKSERRSLVIL